VRVELRWLVVGLVVGVLLVLILLAIALTRRARLLEGLDFRINGPDVPQNVLMAVKAAERAAYSEMPTPRRLAEDAQDALTMLWPQMVYRLDFSIGAYRIKAHTVHQLLDYAIEQGYLTLYTPRGRRLNKALPLLAIQPGLNDWQAALVLQSLKDRHPMMRDRRWNDIAADPNAIAALYSGYTGAGGAWTLWESDVQPGPVSRHRLGYDESSGTYARIPSPSQ